VRHLDEALTGFAAHALGGRVIRDQLRMRFLQRLQLPHHRVVFRVADFRRVQYVIEIFVMAQFLAQSFDFVGDGTHRDVILEKSLNISSRS
jgi:hypothetical protein